LLSHAIKTKHGVITIESYQGKKKGKHSVDWHVSMIDKIYPDTRVLLVDDISDSGGSLIKIIKVLQELGAKKSNIDTATIHYKKKSKFKPTYFAEQIKDSDWINYPWEIHE
jgi:hypoxanthine phosphoribosyltransferase